MSSTLPNAFSRLTLVQKINLGLLAAGVVALSARLWPGWQANPDLSHGFFMPIIFLVLLWESRNRGTPRVVRPGPLTNAIFSVLLLGGLLALVAAGLYAAAVDWSHALVSLMLSLSLVLFLAAGLLAYSSENVRFIGLNWPAIVALVLWILSAPIPPGTYTRLTLSLQLWVSENVLRALHLVGIPAIRHGNIIELANTTVGVEEACSGVRSLVSCVFAALFFSATLVRRPWARALIIMLSAPLALGMNFLRSLALTLLSNAGIDISGPWHDWTGFAVLGITAAILGGLALLLERNGKLETSSPLQPPVQLRTPGLIHALTAGTGVAIVLVCVFVQNTRPSDRQELPAPDLFSLMPAAADGWDVRTINLYEFTGTLHTEHLAQRRYLRTNESNPVDVTVYLAYWRAGQAPVSLVASHTPDACLPGSGWTPQPTPEVRTKLVVDQHTIADAEYRLFRSGEYPQHVWFWHLYDGRPISYRDPYSPVELLRIAWRYGFRHDGDQVFVRFSSNRPWSQIANEPLVKELFARLKTVGL